MAKYNHNHTKAQKAVEKLQSYMPKKAPTVIPRDKIEAANQKVLEYKKLADKMKLIAIGSAILATIELTIILYYVRKFDI